MTIPQKGWSQFVQDMTASWGANAGVVPVLSPGDILLAIFEATSAQLDFIQAQVFLVLQLTRASTSTGADLDTWMADFDFTRLPATFATGPVVFGKFLAAAAPISIPAATLVGGVQTGGALVQTTGGGTVFQVVADSAQSAYNAVSNAYLLPAGATSVTVTVQAVTAGSASNVAAGGITQLGSQLAGIDTVTNLVPLQNGVDAESDAAFRARFVLYLSTLAKATKSAILAAAEGVQQGLQIAAVENVNPTGQTQLGAFTVFVDDGTGNPPASLLDAVFAAVDATRAFSVQPFVSAPIITSANIVVPIRPAANFTLGPLQPLVIAAIVDMVDQLATGATLTTSSIVVAALSVTGVASVQASGVTINGSTADLVPSAVSEVRTNTTVVDVTQY